MTRRAWWIVLALVALAITIEIAVRSYSPAKGVVTIVNPNDGPMDDLTLTYDGARVDLGRVPAGGSVNAFFTAGPLGRLVVEFNQVGNPLTKLEVDDFDPAQNRRDGLKLVLTIRKGQVERMVEDSESGDLWAGIRSGLESWFGYQARMVR